MIEEMNEETLFLKSKFDETNTFNILKKIYASDANFIVKRGAARLAIEGLMGENKILSSKILDYHLSMIKDDYEKVQEIEYFLSIDYKYSEFFCIKKVELSIKNLTLDPNRIEDLERTLDFAEKKSEENETYPYLLRIYELKCLIYEAQRKPSKYIEEYKSKIDELKYDMFNNPKELTQKRKNKREKENQSNIEVQSVEKEGKKHKSKKLKILMVIVLLLVIGNIALIGVNFAKNNTNLNDLNMSINKNNVQTENTNSTQDKKKNDTENISKKEEKTSEDNKSIQEPSIQLEVPYTYSEYPDYDDLKKRRFMEIEELVTKYYNGYEKAVANAEYSYVQEYLASGGQLSTELKKSIPDRHKDVYVKHFKIYNFEDEATESSFQMDTVFVVEGKTIQIETRRYEILYDSYCENPVIYGYTNWDIIYKQEYNPNVDKFDFKNYRKYLKQS